MSTPSAHVLAFRQTPSSFRTPDVLVGPSPSMTRIWSQIRRVAPYYRTALITGESGTGHEAVARALHGLSPLDKGPFRTLTPHEAERTLTGPVLPRFQQDTLFFSEIDQLSPAAQQGLLRLLRIRRPQQVAIIAALCGPPDALRPLVSAGAFSSALTASISALHIHLPALRDRVEDIPTLANHLLQADARSRNLHAPILPSHILESLTHHPLPGNLDQLQNILRAVLKQSAEDVPLDIESFLEEPAPAAIAAPEPVRLLKLEDVVQQHIRAVLHACNGNKLRAAEVLGISRSTLYRMLDAGNVTRLPFAV